MKEAVTPQSFWTALSLIYGICAVVLLVFFLWMRRNSRRQTESRLGVSNLSTIPGAGNIEKVCPKAALMPSRFIKRKPEKVVDIPIDGSAYLNWTSVDVDPAGKAFVSLGERVLERPGFMSVNVCRREDGLILTIPHAESSSKYEWTPQPLLRHGHYLPVVRIEEERSDEGQKTA